MAVTVHTPSPALNADDNNPTTNFRVFVKLSAASNGQIRVRFKAGAVTNTMNIAGAAFGKWDGNVISSTGADMTTAPFRLTFSGSNGTTIAAGSTGVTDFITHTGLTLNANDWLIVTFYHGVSGTSNSSERYSLGHADATTVFQSVATDYSQLQAVAGTGTWGTVGGNIQPGNAGGYNFSVDLVETNDPSGTTGTLAATEAKDTAAFTGTVTGNAGVLAATEAKDTAAATGTVRWNATLAATEASDTALINGAVRWNATLAASEAPDTALINATTRWDAVLAAVEASDIVLVQGTVTTAGTISGGLSAFEAPDVAAITGTVTGNTGVLAASEAPDTAAVTGTVFDVIAGTLNAFEAADAATITATLGPVPIAGVLAAVEARDTASITGNLVLPPVTGILTASEARDTAYITADVPQFLPGVLHFGRRVTISRW